ncbi:MAG: signal recognition particle-docking protein FtsY [Deltaproteobacteria bacterium]|nr:signal recognition particle-docking protein FtsY [Deltaproteobacteria bacterium]
MSTEVVVFLAILVALALGVAIAIKRARRAELPPAKRAEKLAPPKPTPPLKERVAAPPALKPPPEEVTAERLEVTPPKEKPTMVPEPAVVRAAREAKPLKVGLERTRGGFIAKIGALFQGKKTIDPQTIDRLEEVLLTADIGVKTSQKLFESVKGQLSRDQLADVETIWDKIKEQSTAILDVGAPPLDFEVAKPLVLLVVGVNGVGKTTTIGKLAAKLTQNGKKVLLAAGDTFRAAATEQLEIWGQRTGCPIIKGKEGGDPSSVVFEAIRHAQAEGYDVLIADTAGRLHTKSDLMEELQKVRRVASKAMPQAPHETFLVVDSTTGQNAIAQAQMFKEALDITGIVLTKLDGTAKGGVVLGICDTLKLPIRYIGIGEKVEDLREFNAAEFVAALFDREGESKAA